MSANGVGSAILFLETQLHQADRNRIVAEDNLQKSNALIANFQNQIQCLTFSAICLLVDNLAGRCSERTWIHLNADILPTIGAYCHLLHTTSAIRDKIIEKYLVATSEVSSLKNQITKAILEPDFFPLPGTKTTENIFESDFSPHNASAKRQKKTE